MNIKDIKELLKKEGASFVGIQNGYREIPPYVLFNTKISGSTLMIPVDEISEATIRAKLIEHKKKLQGGK